MKAKTLLPALLLLCLMFMGSYTQAQTSDSVFYRHHIGVNTRVVLDKVIDKESLTPLQLLYKYQLTPRSALRLSVEGMYAKSDSSRSYLDRLDEVTEFTYGGSLGYERQQTFGRLLVFYYGVDAVFHQWGKNTEILNSFQDVDQKLKQVYVNDRYATTSFGLRPFVGLRVNVGKRLYLSTETALSLRREKKTEDLYGTVTVFSDEGEGVTYSNGDYTVNMSVISYLPFNGVNIHYTF